MASARPGYRSERLGERKGAAMSLEDLGNIGEFVAAAAVIVSLIYLAVQIRQNTKSVRAAALQDVIGGSASFVRDVYRDSELTRIWFSGSDDFQSVTGIDRRRFHFLIVAYFRQAENMYSQSLKGLLKDEDWEGLRKSVFDGAALPGMREWWNSNSLRFNSDFRRLVEEELAKRNAQQLTGGTASQETSEVPT
jgi:hypothetical protein